MGHTNFSQSMGRRAAAVLSAALLVFALGAPAFAQYAQQYPQQNPNPYPAPAPGPQEQVGQQPPAQQPLMPPEQLDNLVAPIALYPDPLLGQVLAASTYPLEVVEAEQWLQQNGNLHGQDLINAAREQNWDPSVQAIVAFPDVLAMLNRDVRWTTDLGNAFLAQQQDVMAAVQRMRQRAEANGRLSSNADQTVTTDTQNGQSAVVIEPANPQYIYVPEYNPDYIWGPPAWGYYPPLWYPPVSFGFGFYPGIYLGGFFPGWGVGFGGWGLGWGWGFGWFGGGGLFLNAGFFSHWGYHPYWGDRFGGDRFRGGFAGGRVGWEHDPYHRGGVPYANRGVASRFASTSRYSAGRVAGGNAFSAARSGSFNQTRGGGFNGGARGGGVNGAARGGAGAGGGWQHFGGTGAGSPRGFGLENRAGNSGGWQHFGSPAPSARGSVAPRGGAESFRGNSGQSFNSAPRSFNSAPRSFAAPAAPRSNFGGGGSARGFSGGGGGRQFGGGGGGARSFGGGGGGGGHFGGGGGHSGGGGGHGRR